MGIETLRKRGVKCSLKGVSNQQAIDDADIVFLAIPYKHLVGTFQTLQGFMNKIVISPVNSMEKQDFFTCLPPMKDLPPFSSKK